MVDTDLAVGLQASDNPFRQNVWNVSENLFNDILHFGFKYTPDLVRFVSNFQQKNTYLDAERVIVVACHYALLVCASDKQTNSAFYKLISIFLKSCGTTDVAVDFLQRLGICMGAKTARRAR